MDASGEEDDDVDMEEPEDDDDDDDEDFGVNTSKKKKTASAVPKRSSKKASPNRSKGEFPTCHQSICTSPLTAPISFLAESPAGQWKSKSNKVEASEDEDFGKKVHRKRNTVTSKAKRVSRVSSVFTNGSDSEAFKFSRTGKQVNYNEKEVDYGLGESEDGEDEVRPKANVDFEGAEADEIEGVFGWSRDESRMDDAVDLPFENIVGPALRPSALTQICSMETSSLLVALPHQVEVLLSLAQHGRALFVLQSGKLPRIQATRQLHQVHVCLRAAYPSSRTQRLPTDERGHGELPHRTGTQKGRARKLAKRRTCGGYKNRQEVGVEAISLQMDWPAVSRVDMGKRARYQGAESNGNRRVL